MPAPHVLIIEDDSDIARLLKFDLQDAGYRVTHASGVMSGLIRLREDPPALVLLDLGLPDGTGREVLLRIRQHGILPVIVLTAQGDPDSKVELLNLGANDYLVKPVDFEELLARVSRQLKRVSNDLLIVGALEISESWQMARYRGKEIPLSSIEFQILRMLSKQPGQLYTRAEIYDQVWGIDSPVNTNLLSVHMANLRVKLHKAGGYGLIRTARGFGYALRIKAD